MGPKIYTLLRCCSKKVDDGNTTSFKLAPKIKQQYGKTTSVSFLL